MFVTLAEEVNGKQDKALGLWWDFLSDFTSYGYKYWNFKYRWANKVEKEWGLSELIQGDTNDDLSYSEQIIHFSRTELGVLLEDVYSTHCILKDEESSSIIFDFSRIGGGLVQKSSKHQFGEISVYKDSPQNALDAVVDEFFDEKDKIILLKEHERRVEVKNAIEPLLSGLDSLLYRVENTHYNLLLKGKEVLNTKHDLVDFSAIVSFIWEYRNRYSL